MRLITLPLAFVLLLGFSGSAAAQDAEQYFQTNCSACHRLDSTRVVGPGLQGVLDRQNRQWLVEFIMDPNSKLDGGDPYAQELLAAANGVRMLKLGVDSAMANALLDYIESQGGAGGSAAAPVEEEISFTAEQVSDGINYFIGQRSLRNGAPSCNSCHTTHSVGSWGGGHLGPDLTDVIHRLGGRRALTGWLGIPGSATMAPVFRDHKLTSEEIDALVAFLEAEGSSGAADAPSSTANFLGVGILAAIALLALFGFLWKDRYTATRIPMVEKSKR